MDTIKKLLYLFLILLVVSCTNEDKISTQSDRLAGKTFLFPAVASQSECEAIQQSNPAFNCSNILIFETTDYDPSHTEAIIVFTDIAANATYEIDNNILTMQVQNSDMDLESPMVFTINNETNVLTRISDNSDDEWKEDREGVAVWDL